jgi:hypothetical protein
MPREAPPTPRQVTFTITVEHGRNAALIRMLSDSEPSQRAGYAGPLAEHEPLLDEVRIMGSHRARMAGAPQSIGEVHSWRCLIQCLPGDVELVREGLERLQAGDESLLRAFLSLPPVTPQDGRQWDGPDPIAHGPRRI